MPKHSKEWFLNWLHNTPIYRYTKGQNGNLPRETNVKYLVDIWLPSHAPTLTTEFGQEISRICSRFLHESCRAFSPLASRIKICSIWIRILGFMAQILKCVWAGPRQKTGSLPAQFWPIYSLNFKIHVRGTFVDNWISFPKH